MILLHKAVTLEQEMCIYKITEYSRKKSLIFFIIWNKLFQRRYFTLKNGGGGSGHNQFELKKTKKQWWYTHVKIILFSKGDGATRVEVLTSLKNLTSKKKILFHKSSKGMRMVFGLNLE